MKVKINGKVYDAEKDTILIHLNPLTKFNIQNMPDDKSIYACCPLSKTDEELKEEALTFKKQVNS